MKIGFSADHAGYKLKMFLIELLQNEGNEITDFGTNSIESVDYPDFAHPLALAVESGEVDCGIAVCGTGNGINMTLNKHQKIRAALCWNCEIAALARKHNNANVCSLPARFISENEAAKIVETFLKSDFEDGRHQRRIDKIPCII
ncbi:MAG: ribose 5-phosphate isomerase B [Prevotellaceae bacterium]|jgi:ribose 5-phosphate isomerase B|nr:ribose 5-phosphate isomerase B [Prevotellaceae bacterium]